jgi:hypothetical protein
MKSTNQIFKISIILLLLISFLSGCLESGVVYELAGEKAAITIPKSTYSTLVLDVRLNVGSINLLTIPSASYFVDVITTVSIRQGSNGTLEAAQSGSVQALSTDILKLGFDSNDIDSEPDYKYDLWINVGGNITLDIKFFITTGDIHTTIDDSDSTVSSLKLNSTTGSIDLALGNVFFY